MHDDNQDKSSRVAAIAIAIALGAVGATVLLLVQPPAAFASAAPQPSAPPPPAIAGLP